MLTRTAERYPEHIAVVFNEVNLTYRELEALVNIFANALLDLGIRKGQTVCLFMTNRTEYVVSWFAITRIGAVASPMNPSFKEREVAYQLSNSEAVAIVLQHQLLPLVQAVRDCISHRTFWNWYWHARWRRRASQVLQSHVPG